MTLTIGSLVTLLIWVCVIGLLLWLVFYVLGQFALPDPFGRVLRVVAVVIAVLIVIALLLQVMGMGPVVVGIKTSAVLLSIA